jgi:hypothetical protein
MIAWRCPHCGTFQAESSRCFLCGRSATSCGTCANFRLSVVGGVGYCALDKRREPLSGDEQRDCWTSAASAPVANVEPDDLAFTGLLDALDGAVIDLPRRGAVRPVSGH